MAKPTPIAEILPTAIPEPPPRRPAGADRQ
jgi:hypothetical protein